MLVGEKVCISKKPILEIGEVEYVTDIIHDRTSKTNYIIIGLSSKGIHAFNKIFHSLPNSQFVLVLENIGLGRFTLNKEVTNLRIGGDVDLETLTRIRSVLKKLPPVKSQ